jgi:alpha 1,2-mannosyltransferase
MNEPFYAVRTPVLAVGSRINGTWFSAGMKQGDPVQDYGLQHPLEANKAGSHDEEKPASAKPLFLHNNMVKLACQ